MLNFISKKHLKEFFWDFECSNVYFDELDSFRKEIQGDLMGKVDCVMEACQKSYGEGKSEGKSEGLLEGKYEASIDIAKKMLVKGTYSLEEISDVTGLPLDVVSELKKL